MLARKCSNCKKHVSNLEYRVLRIDGEWRDLCQPCFMMMKEKNAGED